MGLQEATESPCPCDHDDEVGHEIQGDLTQRCPHSYTKPVHMHKSIYHSL